MVFNKIVDRYLVFSFCSHFRNTTTNPSSKLTVADTTLSIFTDMFYLFLLN
jgi:hypothetical protein